MDIFDNHIKLVKDDLSKSIIPKSKLSVAASCFSIYAYEELKKELNSIDELRFLFTSPTFVEENFTKEKREFYIPKLSRERSVYGNEFEIKLRNQLTQKAIAKECAEWIRKKVTFKSNITEGAALGLISITSKNESSVYMPIKSFSTADLGISKGNDLIWAVTKFDSPFSQQYLQMFDQVWKSPKLAKDVTEEVIEKITSVYQENPPELIYFMTLNNIFKEFLDDISDDNIANEATGFKGSKIWNKMYDFQKDAALAVINKLETHNGCILADSVGLGKTFTALGVIKYYENRNKSVLVLCPKKLKDNWINFRGNLTTNPLVKDRLRYDVLFHTDLLREKGSSATGLPLDRINWGNYDLVVIDESHNFRNGGSLDEIDEEDDDKPKFNRYTALLNKVIRAGVKTKVLMLSATPVNNRFTDLKNQLALAYEGKTEIIDSKLKKSANTTAGIDSIFKQAQRVYNSWCKEEDPNERTTEKLLEKLDFDFFELLDAVTIARSRKHIQRYYDMNSIGRFPDRLKPISLQPKLTDIEGSTNYKEIYDLLMRLHLAIYTPSVFLLPTKRAKYQKDLKNLTLEIREIGLRNLISTNLLKRMESSVHSFRLTVSRIMANIHSALELINRFMASKQSKLGVIGVGCDGYDCRLNTGEDALKPLLEEGNKRGGERIRSLLSSLEQPSSQEDCIAKQSTTARNDDDGTGVSNTLSLNNVCSDSVTTPTCQKQVTSPQGEALGFSYTTNLDYVDDFSGDDQEQENFVFGKKMKIEISDMDYRRWHSLLKEDIEVLQEINDKIANIDSAHDSKLSELRKIISQKVNSPINNNNRKILIFTAFKDTAEYLFENIKDWAKSEFNMETACVSGDAIQCTIEGVSKDMNEVLTLFSPVSKEKAVVMPKNTNNIDILIATDCISEGQNLQDCDYCINYDIHWNPVRIIQRFGRIDRIGSINEKIQLVNFWPDITLDEYINLKGKVESRMKISVLTATGDDDYITNEKGDLAYRRKQLEHLQNEVVDFEDMSESLSIMDLGLNDFRIDLLTYIKTHPNPENLPFGINAVVKGEKPGVIFVLRNRNEGINIKHRNRLHPFYMIYIGDDGEVIENYLAPKRILDEMRALAKGKTAPDFELCHRFNNETNDGRKMDKYSELLKQAVISMIQVKEESDVDSFFGDDETSFLNDTIKGLDEFELICFMVVKND